jgi:Flp pilus assembly secretin CpaC
MAASLTFACLLVLADGIAARADDGMMRVFLNHAKVLKLDRPVSKVIVGNAKVADATVADSRTIVLTGKAFGTTNLVLLDADGNALLDERILVSIDEGNTVRMFRQTERTILSCTPSCEVHQELDAGQK